MDKKPATAKAFTDEEKWEIKETGKYILTAMDTIGKNGDAYPHAGEHGDCKNAVSQSALHRDLAGAEGGHPRGEPRGSEHRNAVHPVPAQVQARRPNQSAASQAQRVRRRYRGAQARQK